jgi:putative ABC transport system substrate-binding protein
MLNHSAQQAQSRHAKRWHVAGVWLLILVLCEPLSAFAGKDVLVVIAEHSLAHEEVLQGIRTSLGDAANREIALRIVTTTDFRESASMGASRNSPDLIVPVGLAAAGAVLASHPQTRIYCAFLPQLTYIELLRVHGYGAGEAQRRSSALFLDQPAARQLKLLRIALPRYKRVGVVLGPESRRNEAALQRAAAKTGLELNVERIDDEKQLIHALYQVLGESDVLLAVPDPLVLNKSTAQSALLTAYRLGKPVIGYSHGYVNAGALFAVYSTPAQIGHQVGEMLPSLLESPHEGLPPPQYPRYFSVEVNERVARSLGLTLAASAQLTKKLAESAMEAAHE